MCLCKPVHSESAVKIRRDASVDGGAQRQTEQRETNNSVAEREPGVRLLERAHEPYIALCLQASGSPQGRFAHMSWPRATVS